VHLLKEEKKALQEASRRLSEELGHNFQQVTDFETKEKKIADLIHKNQKLSHLLEKEIADKNQKQQTQEQLELQEIKQKEQIDLLNRVLSSVEAKNVALTESNTTLLQNYTNATSVIEKLQLQIQNLQFSSNFSSSEDIVIAYEKRLEEWEIKYSEVRKKLDSTIHELEKKKSKVEELNQVVKVLLLSKETLEKEIAQAQDEMISMNVSLKRHEAKIEVLERALSERQPMPTCKSKIIYQNDHTQEVKANECN
jgi:chromosome segregation ATPase